MVQDSTEAPSSVAAAENNGSPGYVLLALVAIYALGHLDRQILSLLVEPLKQDLHINDTQISLLHGFTFALFMAVAGLPIGRLMDLKRRTTVIAAGVVTWGLMTMGCGMASTFLELTVLRMGVGVGEAVLTPGAHSIIADAVPRKRLGFAMGVFGVGSYIGGGLAFILGAFVLVAVQGLGPIQLPGFGAFRPWQLVFLAVGAPALPMALWALSLPEPPRPTRAIPIDRSIHATARFFLTQRTSIGLVNLTGGFAAMAGYSLSAWFPTVLIRTFHWTASAAGAGYGIMVMVCGAAGVVCGGLLGDFAVARGYANGRLMVMGTTAVCAAPLAWAAPLAGSAWAGLQLLAPATLLITMSLGLLPSVQQGIVPNELRGSASALGTLMVNLIGLGFGPAAVAIATDDVFRNPAAVGRSLALVAPSALLISACCAVACLRPYVRSVTSLAPSDAAGY